MSFSINPRVSDRAVRNATLASKALSSWLEKITPIGASTPARDLAAVNTAADHLLECLTALSIGGAFIPAAGGGQHLSSTAPGNSLIDNIATTEVMKRMQGVK
jgi:hypothetical protein